MKDRQFVNTVADLFLNENHVFLAFTCEYTRSISRPSAIYLNQVKVSKKSLIPVVAGFIRDKSLGLDPKNIWPKMLDDIVQCMIDKVSSHQATFILERQKEVSKHIVYHSNFF